MTEHPIIFQGWGVRAILTGEKTQTRRVIRKPEKYESIRDCAFCCPYGRPGDLLWVRETWIEDDQTDRGDGHGEIIYSADGTPAWKWPGWRWRPSIHMPRWASRLTLRLLDVRVQRVQEITKKDAQAEGTTGLIGAMTGFLPYAWESINLARGYGWGANPWVWALTFERVNA